MVNDSLISAVIKNRRCCHVSDHVRVLHLGKRYLTSYTSLRLCAK